MTWTASWTSAPATARPREAVFQEVERLVEQGDRAGIDLRRTAEGYGLTVTVGFYLAAKPTG